MERKLRVWNARSKQCVCAKSVPEESEVLGWDLDDALGVRELKR